MIYITLFMSACASSSCQSTQESLQKTEYPAPVGEFKIQNPSGLKGGYMVEFEGYDGGAHTAFLEGFWKFGELCWTTEGGTFSIEERMDNDMVKVRYHNSSVIVQEDSPSPCPDYALFIIDKSLLK